MDATDDAAFAVPGARPSRPRTLVLHHPECLAHSNGSSHQEAPGRVTAILSAIAAAFNAGQVELRGDAPLASDEQILRVHSPAYLRVLTLLHDLVNRERLDRLPFTPAVQRAVHGVPKASAKQGFGDTAFGPGTWGAARRAAGAVCTAVEAVLGGASTHALCVVRPPGHHAGINGLPSPWGGEAHDSCGFCLLNTAAIGALHAMERGATRVAIIDFDAHHGNGTEEIVRAWPGARGCAPAPRRSLFFFSVHLFDVERSSAVAGGAGGEGGVPSPDRRVTRGMRAGETAPSAFPPQAGAGAGAGVERPAKRLRLVVRPPIPPPLVLSGGAGAWGASASEAEGQEEGGEEGAALVTPRGVGMGWGRPPALDLPSPLASLTFLAGQPLAATALTAGRGDPHSTTTTTYAFYPGSGKESVLAANVINAPLVPLWRERRDRRDRVSRRPATGGFGWQAVRRIVDEKLVPSLRAFEPDIILLSAGFDGGVGDFGNVKNDGAGRAHALHGLNLRPEDYHWITERVLSVARLTCPGRVVAVLEGGYGVVKHRTARAGEEPGEFVEECGSLGEEGGCGEGGDTVPYLCRTALGLNCCELLRALVQDGAPRDGAAAEGNEAAADLLRELGEAVPPGAPDAAGAPQPKA